VRRHNAVLIKSLQTKHSLATVVGEFSRGGSLFSVKARTMGRKKEKQNRTEETKTFFNSTKNKVRFFQGRREARRPIAPIMMGLSTLGSPIIFIPIET
jgi:hypothetical protein